MEINEILTAIRERKGVPELLHHLRCSAVSYYSVDRSAASYLAYCHEIGVGVECDPYTAMLWYRLALRDASTQWQQSWVAERLALLEKMNLRPKYGVGEKIRIEDCEIGTIVNSTAPCAPMAAPNSTVTTPTSSPPPKSLLISD